MVARARGATAGPIPRPIAKGRPGCGFPRPWSVYGWLEVNLPRSPAWPTMTASPMTSGTSLLLWNALAPRRAGSRPHSFNEWARLGLGRTDAATSTIGWRDRRRRGARVWEAAIAEEWDAPTSGSMGTSRARTCCSATTACAG